MKIQYKAEQCKFIIVGANSGIGMALSSELLRSGGKVIGIDIQEESKLERETLNMYLQCDPKDLQSMNQVCKVISEKYQAIDGLVNLSGSITQWKPIKDISYEEWLETYDIGLKSCFNSCKVFTQLLEKSTKAAIVNMSSGLAFIGQKNYGPYSASKAAVISLSKTLAAELAPSIRVNSIAPGAVDTNFLKRDDGSVRINVEAYEKIVPLGRMSEPSEIADLIMFLLSSGSGHITGQCIHINGGASMR